MTIDRSKMIDTSKTHRSIRMLGATWALTFALLALNVARADAHGVISPPVAKSGNLQQFSLSVPTEINAAAGRVSSMRRPVVPERDPW